MDHQPKAQNTNRTKILYTFRREFMLFAMGMDQMGNRYRLSSHNQFIVNFFVIIDALNQALEEHKIDETIILETYRKI